MNPSRIGSGIDDGFEALLRTFDLAQLEGHGSSIFGLWGDLRLGYLNPAWSRFAADNGGEPAISERWSLRALTTEAIPESLRPFYLNLYQQCLESSEPRNHDYECSSDSLYRQFRMTVYPLREGEGLLVVNSLRIERPHNRFSQALVEQEYTDESNLIHQCCHCRRTRRVGSVDQWDWVPQLVREMPLNTSHSLCPICFDYHYRPRI